MKEAEAQIKAWENTLAERKQIAAACGAKLESQTKHIKSMKPVIDLAPLKLKLSQLEQTNAMIRTQKQRAKLLDDRQEASKKSLELTTLIARLEQEKKNAIASAKFPLAGISFDEVGVLFNGRPLSEESTGNRIRASVAIGMALNPKLRVVFIRDGSLLDSKGLALLGQMATEMNFQIWIEDARSTDPAAIVIEDGAQQQQTSK